MFRGVPGQEAQEVDGAPVSGGEDFPVEGGGAGEADIVGEQQAADLEQAAAVGQGREIGLLVDVQEDEVEGTGHGGHEL